MTNRASASAFQDLLGRGGHEVTTARKAEAALEVLAASQFDLVVMDICLAGIDGLEALRRIKQQQPTLPVIVMTGHGTMQTAIEATKLGAFDYHRETVRPVRDAHADRDGVGGLSLDSHAKWSSTPRGQPL